MIYSLQRSIISHSTESRAGIVIDQYQKKNFKCGNMTRTPLSGIPPIVEKTILQWELNIPLPRAEFTFEFTKVSYDSTLSELW